MTWLYLVLALGPSVFALPAFVLTPPWQLVQRSLAQDTPITWWIGVKAAKPHALVHAFDNVTNPMHPQFMKYLDKNATNVLTRPSRVALPTIYRWLNQMNTTYSDGTNILIVQSSVGVVEELLNTTIALVTSSTHRALKAIDLIHIPPTVLKYIDFVSINRPSSPKVFPMAMAKKSLSYDKVTPKFLRVLYDIPPPNELSVQDNRSTQSIASFYENSFNLTDLTDFYQDIGESLFGPIIARGNQINDELIPHSEASLDLQYISAMAPNATTYVWSMAGRNPFSYIDEPFLEWANDVLDQDRPPLVHSISYSDNEKNLAEINPDYMHAFDKMLMKMALRGLTVLVSSGDDGVMGLSYRQQNITLEEACKVSGPQWPSSSPFITSVGATQMDETREVVCSAGQGGRITSGGGFSSFYTRPSYQKNAVLHYLNSSKLPPSSYFNSSGRGYPDISAFGTHYRVRVGGKWRSISGTSASSPVVAAMVTLWNELRLRQNKPPLGFINKALYHFQQFDAFYDIESGSNNDGKIQGSYVPTCQYGFNAVKGWDPVTGLGTPKFDVLAQLFNQIEEIMRNSTVSVVLHRNKNSIRNGKPGFSVWKGILYFFTTLVLVDGIAILIMKAWITWHPRQARYERMSNNSIPSPMPAHEKDDSNIL
ncbi:tripeptidyl-peptidase [Thraustotheca clavata]|uniref:subtilisin n=1 Tax=Thraustotheca clavata TaxID=74557 RepID=A0A1V9ZXY4_9STRA|nr:tripeptidyl-peptidase [Thraustotheca clavata]